MYEEKNPHLARGYKMGTDGNPSSGRARIGDMFVALAECRGRRCQSRVRASHGALSCSRDTPVSTRRTAVPKRRAAKKETKMRIGESARGVPGVFTEREHPSLASMPSRPFLERAANEGYLPYGYPAAVSESVISLRPTTPTAPRRLGSITA